MTHRTRFSSTRRRFVQGSAAAAASTFFIGRARAADPEFVMKVATVAPPGTPWATELQRLKSAIKTQSEGRIKVKTYLGGALGGEIETAEATKRGTIQVFGGTAGALSALVPEIEMLELPFLFPNEKAADKILDTVIREDLDALLWERGFKLMFYSENGYRSIGSTFPVSSPADLRGKKMRSQQSDVHLDTWKSMGASPVPITVTEVLSSLQTGVVEGFDNTPLFAFAASWHQAISHFTLTRHIYQPGIVLCSRKFWEELPPDLQTIVMGDPADLAKKGRRGVRAIAPMLEQNFVNAGITLSKLSDGERSAFASKAEEVHTKFRNGTTAQGKAILDKIKAAL
ncbi:TRAP transporter substrate-binding protein [Paraliomyxa miuraensis]|uniref:TRAP transporter substrate-binding protein n=1 Tax=Paraliomyxa miuraensis TaxID=376150 RepID=UPI002258C215|nr:TRAP transporter substrate-binding protein [Paraliomyxa miuraensis]MCX4247314.1 TRAP transporter substrate-binding protein [Paraliomyxa miuraensis]